MGVQDNPRQSRCLGVFGLSLYTQERDLREVFEHYGPIDDLQIVYDHQTGRSRGFAFIYMRNYEDAVEVSVWVLYIIITVFCVSAASTVMTMSVCLLVCLSARITQKLHGQFFCACCFLPSVL